MPTLDWLDRDEAFRIAERVSTRVLRPHSAGGVFGDAASGNLLNLHAVPKEIESEQVGRLWAERSAGRCRFAFAFKQDAGRSLTAQIDAALA